MKLFIRTDASIQIGSGHVMRCLTLADRLRERGATVHFICRELPGHLGDLLAAKGYPVHWLPAPAPDAEPVPAHTAHSAWLGVPWEVDAEQTRAALVGLPEVDWLIVDHYALDRRWESQLRPDVSKIMVIDDLANRPHDCDLLLDQNLYPNLEHRYDGLVPTHCRKLLGPRYALLRPEFREARKTLRVRDGSIRRILIFFGGSDPTNETTKALEAIRLLDRPDISVDVVVGETNPHKEEIRVLCTTLPNVTYHCQISNMAELMAAADLAIGAGGVANWERCALGLPALVASVAFNQEEVSEAIAAIGACIYLGTSNSLATERLLGLLREACVNPSLLSFMNKCGLELVDTRGVRRVANVLSPSTIQLRKAVKSDCRNVYFWRNAEETRRYSGNGEIIPYDTHVKWYSETLADCNRSLLIGEVDGTPVGILRYDVDGTQATISAYLVPGMQGRGFGSALIEAGTHWVRLHLPSVKTIVARVSSANLASISTFQKAGYHQEFCVFKKYLE